MIRRNLLGMSYPRCERYGICSIRGTEAPCEIMKFVAAFSPSLQVERDSEDICALVARSGLMRGKPLKLIAASSFYIGCRRNLAPVTLKEVAAVSGDSARDIGRGTKHLVDSLRFRLPAIDETEYVSLLLSKLRKSPEIGWQALAIIKKAKAAGLEGRKPITLAAATVYAACIKNCNDVTQQDVADAAGISVEAVRSCFWKLREMMGRASEQRGYPSKRPLASDTRAGDSIKPPKEATENTAGGSEL